MAGISMGWIGTKWMKPLDPYTFKARIQPALLAILPLGILLLVWMPDGSLLTGGLLGIIGTGGGTALLAQLGRDQGRRKQPALWMSWGGPPTTRLLRYRDTPNKVILIQWRGKLEKLMNRALPTEEEETEDPDWGRPSNTTRPSISFGRLLVIAPSFHWFLPKTSTTAFAGTFGA